MKNFKQIRKEEILKSNQNVLDDVKLVMENYPFCNRFEFIFADKLKSELSGETFRKYCPEKKHFNFAIFAKLVKEHPFFEGCQLLAFADTNGFVIVSE